MTANTAISFHASVTAGFVKKHTHFRVYKLASEFSAVCLININFIAISTHKKWYLQLLCNCHYNHLLVNALVCVQKVVICAPILPVSREFTFFC